MTFIGGVYTMMTPQYAPAGARCALHLEVPARLVCARCGNFMCDECSARGLEATCPACRAKRPSDDYPFSRDDFDLGRLWTHAWRAFQREWVMLSLSIIVFVVIAAIGSVATNIVTQVILAIAQVKPDPSNPLGPAFVISMVSSLTLGVVVSTVVQGIGNLGVYRVMVDVLVGRKADVGRMFTQARKLPRYVAVALFNYVVAMVPAVVLIVAPVALVAVASGVSFSELGRGGLPPSAAIPLVLTAGLGTLAFIAFAVWLLPVTLFSAVELVVSDDPWFEVIQRAWRIGSGFRLSLFGYSAVTGLVVAFSVLACCVGVVPGTAFGYMLLLSLFLALRNDPRFPKARHDEGAPGPW